MSRAGRVLNMRYFAYLSEARMAEPVPAMGSPNAAEVDASAPGAAAAAQLGSGPVTAPPPAQAASSDQAEAAAEAALYDREAQLASDGEARARLLLAAGRLQAGRLRDPAAALLRYRAALVAHAGSVEAQLAVAESELAEAAAAGRHDDRVRALERCAELEASPARAAALLGAAAAVAEERLERPALAADLALRAFERIPEDATVRREARRAAEREGRLEDLSRVLSAEANAAGASPREAALAACELARCLAQLGRDEAAREALGRARELGGEDMVVLDTLASLHEQRGEWEAAAEALRARASAHAAGARDEVADLVAGNLRLAEICEERLGRAAEAVAGYEAVLALDPAHRGALVALGRLHARAGDWARLLATFLAERDAAQDPRERAHRAFKAAEVLEERLGHPAEAIELYQQALALDPALHAARQALERRYDLDGRHVDLAALLEDDLAHTDAIEERIALFLRLARLQDDRLGDLASAARACERALEAAPGHVLALRTLSGLYDRAGRFSELVPLNERLLAVTRDPRSAVSLLQRTAEVQEEHLADPLAAAATQERILRIDPAHRPALRALGRIYAGAGRWRELVALWRTDAEAAPSPEAAATLLVRGAEILEQRLGDATEAMAAYREVLTLSPAHVGALGALARLHRARAEWESLVEVLRAEAAARGAPERRAALLGEVAELWEEHLGAPALAAEVHQEALHEVPAFGPSLRALERLLAAAGRHGELARLLAAEAARARPGARAALFVRAARLQAERLGDLPAALEACLAALEDVPGDAAALLLAEELGTARLPAEAAAQPAPGADDLPSWRTRRRELVRARAWGEAHAAWRKEAALLRDPAAAAEALLAAGRIAREQLGDEGAAANDWQHAIQRCPGDRALVERAEDLLRAGPPSLARYEALAARARLEADLPAAERWLEAARLAEEQLADPARALAAADAAVLARPAFAAALRARARLLAAASRGSEAATDLAAALAQGGAPDELRETHLALAALHEGPLGDPARAVSHLHAALALAADHPPALAALARIHRQNANWPAAADALRRLLASPAPDAPARVENLLALAEIRAEAFADTAAALELCQQARALAPEDPAVLEALGRHAEHGGAPAVVADALAAAAAAAPPGPERARAHLRAARVLAAGAGEAPAVVAELERALSADPGLVEARAELAEACAAADPARALEEHRCLLGEEPARVGSWRAIFRLAQAGRANDHAFVAAGVLRFLQASDVRTDGAFQAVKALKAPLTPARPLAEGDWLALRHPRERGPLSDVLALAGDALAEVAQLPAPARGRGRAPAALEQILGELCATVGVAAPALRPGGEGAELQLAPGHPAIVYVGAELTQRQAPAELRFLLARAAARLRAGSALAARLPPDALRELLAATLRQFAPADETLGDAREAIAKAVGRALPRKVRKALEEPARAVMAAGRPDFDAWQAALTATANRAGLLLAADVPAALKVVLREAGPKVSGAAEVAAAVSARADLRELLVFVASDEHLRLRERLGLALPS